MRDRNEAQAEQILEYINNLWKLSIEESEVLESVLNLFSAQKTTEIKQLDYLLNDEIETLLKTLNDREIIDFACDELGMIPEDDEDSMIDALKDLHFDFTSQVSDSDMISSLEADGWNVSMEDYETYRSNITTDLQMEEMKKIFYDLDFISREKILEQIRK